jgi:hypothetical protein
MSTYTLGNFNFMKKNAEKYKLYFDTITKYNLWNYIKNVDRISAYWFDNDVKIIYTSIYTPNNQTKTNFNEFCNYMYVMKQIIDIGWDDFVFDYLNPN